MTSALVLSSKIRFIPAVLLTVGVAYLSLTENPMRSSVMPSDKVLHGAFYILLGIAWMIPKSKIINQKSSISKALLVCLCVTMYGAVLELLQHFCMVTRSGEGLDVLADFIGTLIGVLLVLFFEKIRSLCDQTM